MSSAEGQIFDYLIVGAGSAGALLAGRLTENPNIQVLLLEAGPDFRADACPEPMHSPNPLGITNPVTWPDYQWPQLLVRRTERQDPRLYDRGRGAGGSSAINWQVAHRAELDDYDRWSDDGCIGWSGEELLPAANRIENDLDFGDSPFHGNRGPITISRLPLWEWGKVDLALFEAALAAGYPYHPDLNAPGATGICAIPANRSATGRVSTNEAYLEPARERPNLTVIGDTQVDTLLFDGKRVTGVVAIQAGAAREFHAHETILAAGSVFTPPILLRSGVGPAADLRALGIDVVADLPVGKNLCDHAAVGLSLKLKPEGKATSKDARLLNLYVRYSSGMCGAGENDMVLVARNLNGYDEPAAFDYGALSVLTWQNFSRGELTITSRDPFAMPQIDERLLSDERDLLRLRDGARRLFALSRHGAVQSIAEEIKLGRGVQLATDRTIEDVEHDDRAIDAWMLETARDTWHICGTARMGAPDDPRSVVDPDCRVLGLQGVRVIDTSIFPEVTRANTNLPVLTVAEHMAARLLGE